MFHELQRRLRISLRLYVFCYPCRLTPEPFACPVAHSDRILLQRCNRVIGIDIAWGALQEKTEQFIAQCCLYGLDHHARIVSGVLKVIASKNHWMTRVVDQDGQRSSIRLVDTQHRDHRVHGRGRYPGKVPLEPVHSSVGVHVKAVMADIGRPITGTDAHVNQMRACQLDGVADFVYSGQFPCGRAVRITIHDYRPGVRMGRGYDKRRKTFRSNVLQTSQ